MSQTRARYRPICVGVMRPTCVDPEYISVGELLVPAARASAEPDTAISTTLAAHNAQIAFVRVTVSPHGVQDLDATTEAQTRRLLRTAGESGDWRATGVRLTLLAMLAFSWTSTGAIALYVIGVLVLVGTFLGQIRGAWNWAHAHLAGETPKDTTPQTAQPVSAPSRSAEPRILSIQPTGGSSGQIDFRVELTNEGTRRCRCDVVARVGDAPVVCHPSSLDLLVNTPTESVRVIVARPELGDLIPEFGNENATSLHGKILRVALLVDGEEVAAEEWTEHIYTLEENFQRHHIQQRKWRIARGEETPDDLRNEHLDEMLRRRDEPRPPAYYDV
jgi:hypothetical protein